MIVKYALLLLAGVAIASVSQIVLKLAADKEYGSLLREYLNPAVIIGYFLMFLSTILVILGYRGLEYKNGPVLESLGYIFILVLSILILREKATVKKIIGNILIVAGVVVFYL
jgi:uncharacterized membrane protein